MREFTTIEKVKCSNDIHNDNNMSCNAIKQRYFVCEPDKWQKMQNSNLLLNEEPSVTVVDNGLILPLRKRTDVITTDGSFEGGICTKEGKFVAGHQRDVDSCYLNMACLRGYKPNEQIEVREETVIYGGVLFWHYGHMITEGLSRLWWLAENPSTSYKIVFLELPLMGGFKLYDILKAMGIYENNMEIVKKPTQFKKIIVPQETFYLTDADARIRPAMFKVYDHIRNNIVPDKNKKIYLSRSQYFRHDGVNEQYYENFFRKRGFKIVYPETLSFTEQVAMLAGAEEVVTTQGTLSLQMFFCKQNIKALQLMRDDKPYPPIAMEVYNMDYAIVGANFNFLPFGHAGYNLFLYGPTRYWIDYLNDRHIEYSDEEVDFSTNVLPYLPEYIKQWARNYARPFAYKRIMNQNFTHLIRNIYKVFIKNEFSAEKDKQLSELAEKSIADSYDMNIISRYALQQNLSIIKNANIINMTDITTDILRFNICGLPTFIHYEVNRIDSEKLRVGFHVENTKYADLEQIKNLFNRFVEMLNNVSDGWIVERLNRPKDVWLWLYKWTDRENLDTVLNLLVSITLVNTQLLYSSIKDKQ